MTKLLRVLLSVLALAAALRPAAGRAEDIARKIVPNDVLAIRVVNEPELSQNYRVSGDGKISFPYLNEIEVRDKTTTEIEKLIRDLLDKDYIVNPQVTVQVQEYFKQYITVTGAVNQGGRIELPPDRRIDVIEAISLARDFARDANKDKIVLTRKGQEFKLAYDKLRKDTEQDKRFFLEADDVIEVKRAIF